MPLAGRQAASPKLARMRRALTVSELSPGEFTARLDQLITVYAAAMRPPAEMLPGRRSIMAGHAANPGFRALLATEDGSGEPVGFGYGFHGGGRPVVARHGGPRAGRRATARRPPRPGWTTRSRSPSCTWHRTTRATASAPACCSGSTSDRPERTALLSTRDADTPARRLYRGVGFTDLLTGFAFFPGGEPPYAVMGAELPLRARSGGRARPGRAAGRSPWSPGTS